jgi:hypothetical protein
VTTWNIQAQHAHNLLRLGRVNAALSAWDEYDANALLPPDQRRPLPRPKLTRGGMIFWERGMQRFCSPACQRHWDYHQHAEKRRASRRVRYQCQKHAQSDCGLASPVNIEKPVKVVGGHGVKEPKALTAPARRITWRSRRRGARLLRGQLITTSESTTRPFAGASSARDDVLSAVQHTAPASAKRERRSER